MVHGLANQRKGHNYVVSLIALGPAGLAPQARYRRAAVVGTNPVPQVLHKIAALLFVYNVFSTTLAFHC